MASQLFSTFTEVGLVDTRVNAGTIQLPKTIDIPYRQISLKDIYGNFQNKSLTLTTQFPDTFEDGTTTKVLSNAFGFTTLYAGPTNVWYMTGGTTLTSQTVSSLTVSSISGSGALLTNLPAISSLSLQSTIAGLGIAGYVSTSQLTSTVASLTYGYQTAGFVSSPNLLNHVSTTGLNTSLTSTVASVVYGYQTAGFVSTATIISTTQGLQYAYQTSGFVSSPNLLGLTSTTALNTSLTSTVAGLGQIYLSTAAAAISQANLNSTVQGLGSATYISSTQLLSTTRSYGTYFTTLSASFSSVYASNGYISSLRVDALQLGAGDGWADFGPLRATSLSTLQLQTGALYATSNFIGSVSSPFNAIQFFGLFGNYNNTVLAEVSTGVGTQELLLFKGSSTSDRIRLQTTGSIVFEPGSSARLWASPITSNVTPAMVIDTNSNVGIKTGTTAGITLDVAGLGRFQTVSTLNIQLSSINGLTFGGPINSTVIGLGSSGYVSTTQLTSTVASITYGYQTAGFLSTTTLTSTVAGLGQNYISTAQLLSTTSGIYTFVNSFVDPTELTSTVVGLGTTGYVSSMGLLSTASGLASYITTFIDPVELASTVTGLGSASFVSTLQLTLNITSTVAGLGSIGYVSTTQLTSTVASLVYGYQTAGFVSTATIQSTTSGLQYAYQTSGFVSSPNLLNLVSTTGLNTSLTSTVASLVYGYQTAGFVSTATIQSTTSGLQYAYQTAGFVSSPNLLNHVSTTFLNTSLASTVASLQYAYQTAGFVSTATIVSTTQGLQYAYQTAGFVSTATIQSTTSGLQYAYQTAGFVSSANLLNLVSTTALNTSLVSTVQGLGSATYISSTQFLSTTRSYANAFTSLSASFSSVTASNVFASTLIVNNLQIGTGLGWVNIGPLQTVALSTTQVQTGALYATSNFIGSVSTPFNAIQFYGLFGNYNNTVLAEVSTGVGTQELLLFKGSSTSDRIRLQTTGSIVFEPGSSARLWASSITSNVTPAMIIDTNSNVGIKTGTTAGIALDVAGVGRFQTVSTLNIQLSSINGLTFGGPINSTVIGLGTTGYISTATLTSTVAGLLFTGSSISLSTASLFTSSVQASSISVGNGAWLSNTGLYLSNAQAGGAVGQLITNAGFVKLVAASGWSGGYTGFAITGGDLVNKIYMNAGPNAIGGQIAIGGSNPSPGSGSITLDVFGIARFSSISTFQTVASSIGIGIGQPLTPLDVAGMGRFQQLSTLLFNVSSINGFIPWQPSYLQSTVQGLGTAGYISTASLTSTIVGLGTTGYISTASLTSTIIGLGTTGYISTASLTSTVAALGTAAALLVPYSSLNTATYFQLRTSSTQLYYGTFGSTSQVYIGDINSKYGNATLSTPTLLMEQFPIVIPSVASTIGVTYADVTYTVPAGVTSINVELNGAGGGGGSGSGTLSGGAGGRVTGTLAVTPGETLTVVVGIGGTRPTSYYPVVTGYGGGGSAGGISGVGDSGGGGGRSAIRRGGVDIVTAGGGGGAEGSRYYAGGLGGGTTGGSGGGFQNGEGLGGTQTQGGAGGQGANSSPGSLGIGGNASAYGAGFNGAGGGGGGYYGGGSGNSSGSQPGGGGGGSSYVALLTGTVVNTQGGGAAGGTTSIGSNGSVIISIPGYTQTTLGNIIEVRNYLQYKFIIDPSLNVGVNVSSINSNFKLDVNGAIRATSLSTQQIQASSITGISISTQNIQLSSINGLIFGGPIFSTVIGLGSAGYISTASLTSTVRGLGTAGYISTASLVSTFSASGGLFASTVQGLGTAGYISTASLVSTFSASGGLFASTVRGLGTAGYISTASLTSTVAALGTASALLVPYSSLNTTTYFQIKNSTNQLLLGTNGPASQIYIGDVGAKYGDSVNTYPTVLIEQTIYQQLNIGSSNYAYASGSDQYFTPPAGVTSVTVVVIGGGGASAPSYTGGSGGYVSGTLPVTPLTQYTITIGQGGLTGQNAAWGGGGAAGGASSGGGAGRSAIILSGSDVVTAGGGGGAGAYAGNGGAGGGTTGASGGGTGGGGGGGQSQTLYPGNGGANSGGGGSGTQGGAGYGSSSGGGGGGYFGGGGAGNQQGGGGGGSSYVANLTGTVVNTQGGGASAGNNGSIVISWNFPLIYRNANPLEIRGWQGNKVQIDSYLNMSLSVSSPTSSFRLDVNGIGRMGMPVSSITGTVATFGTASYGIYYYISNSGFSNITLTSVTGFTGWFVTLRNNTTSYLSVAVTGQTNSTPATPFTIAPSNATTIAYDTNYNSGGTAGYAFF